MHYLLVITHVVAAYAAGPGNTLNSSVPPNIAIATTKVAVYDKQADCIEVAKHFSVINFKGYEMKYTADCVPIQDRNAANTDVVQPSKQ